MTLKQKAIIRAMCVFGVAALSAIIVNVILHFVPAVTIGTIFVAGVACFLFYVCYSISLGQLGTGLATWLMQYLNCHGQPR